MQISEETNTLAPQSTTMQRLKLSFFRSESGQYKVVIKVSGQTETVNLHSEAEILEHIQTTSDAEITLYMSKVRKLIGEAYNLVRALQTPTAELVKVKFLELHGNKYPQ